MRPGRPRRHHRSRSSRLVPSALSTLRASPDEPLAPAPIEITVLPRPLIEILPRHEVDDWLFALVKDKTVLVVEIRREAAARGYSWSRVKRAKERLGIESEKLGWGEGWAWSLLLPP
jgi:hypothetical protein